MLRDPRGGGRIARTGVVASGAIIALSGGPVGVSDADTGLYEDLFVS